MSEIRRRGLMLVLSSPSGAGKTTLSRNLLDTDPLITMSVSITTRPRRSNEIEGRDYSFVTKQRFDELVRANELLEYAEVFGNHYGTPSKAVRDALIAGRDILFDIDWQGTQQLKLQAREDVASIFILPPSHEELERRLRARAQDSEETVRARMAQAANEISHWPEYDYVIVNDDLDRAKLKVEAILEAERNRLQRQSGMSEFVRNLISG
jgi:guanylate kinase